MKIFTIEGRTVRVGGGVGKKKERGLLLSMPALVTARDT